MEKSYKNCLKNKYVHNIKRWAACCFASLRITLFFENEFRKSCSFFRPNLKNHMRNQTSVNFGRTFSFQIFKYFIKHHNTRAGLEMCISTRKELWKKLIFDADDFQSSSVDLTQTTIDLPLNSHLNNKHENWKSQRDGGVSLQRAII